MFVDGNGKVLVNEIAPRPHNSGHWTHRRLPGQPVRAAYPGHRRAAAAAGDPPRRRGDEEPDRARRAWRFGRDALAEPGMIPHLYGKAAALPGPQDGARDAAVPARRAAGRFRHTGGAGATGAALVSRIMQAHCITVHLKPLTNAAPGGCSDVQRVAVGDCTFPDRATGRKAVTSQCASRSAPTGVVHGRHRRLFRRGLSSGEIPPWRVRRKSWRAR